jgi:type III pantothenate kinase
LTRDIPFVDINHHSPLPYRLTIEEAHSVGADRLCNIAAAARRGLKNAIVMDLGTAHTYDVLANGAFVGGLIAPGAVTAHDALLDRGAKLPEISFEKPATLIGRHTTEAIQSGSFQQGIGGIYYVLHRLQRAHSGYLTLATGGISQLLADELPPDVLLVPDLTLEGALAILDASQAED